MKETSSELTGNNAGPGQYDLGILGSGAGGKLAAWTYGKQGKRVAVIERKYIGGACPNIACLPSKNIIHSAKVASYFDRAKEFGVDNKGFAIDMAAVRERKRKMVSGLVEVHLEHYKASGTDLIIGSGRFIGPKTLEVTLSDGTTRQVRGTNVMIDTGTHAALDPIPGLAEAEPLTHVEALELGKIPEHLLVLGGGYVGLELSQAMRRFGSKVTIIERHDRLVHQEDDDVTDAVRSPLEDEGIELVLNSQLKRVSGKSGGSVKIALEQNGAEKTLTGTHILVAAGRVPNTKDIGLDLAGVKLTDDGYVQVNERLETTAPGVWAVGDVAGSPKFTHIGVDDFRVVLANIAGGKSVTTNRQVPSCLFTDPELAHVGSSEKAAQAKGVAYRLFKIPMAHAVLRVHTLSETRGFLKALVETNSDRIIGFTAFGVGGRRDYGCSPGCHDCRTTL